MLARRADAGVVMRGVLATYTVLDRAALTKVIGEANYHLEFVRRTWMNLSLFHAVARLPLTYVMQRRLRHSCNRSRGFWGCSAGTTN
jgi:hypothetical protein